MSISHLHSLITHEETVLELVSSLEVSPSAEGPKRWPGLLVSTAQKTVAEVPPGELEPMLIKIRELFLRMWVGKTSPGSMDNRYTKVRTIVRNRFGWESDEYALAKRILRIDTEDKQKIIDRSKELVEDRNHDVKEMDLFTDYFDVIEAHKFSDHIYKRIIATLLACGSRPIELIGGLSTYKKLELDKHVPVYWVEITGLAKKCSTLPPDSNQKRKLTDGVCVIKRPILGMHIDEFLQNVTLIRDLIKNPFRPDVTPPELSKTILWKLGKAMAELYPDRGLTSRSCRAMYANAAWQFVGEKMVPKTNQLTFMADILGHEIGPVPTRHYTICTFKQTSYERCDEKETCQEQPVSQGPLAFATMKG
jgi:hypothetical protein